VNRFRDVVAESKVQLEEDTVDGARAEDADGDPDSPPTVTATQTWTFNQYWNYVDIVLDELREEARTTTTSTEAAEEFVRV